MFDLTGTVALVTGGNGGLGLGYGKGLARAGAKVAVWGRNEEKNAAAIAETILTFASDRATFDARFAAVAQFRRTVQPYGAIPAQKALLARQTGDARWRNVRPPLYPLSEPDTARLAHALEGTS